jgi:hypothetical protein
VPAKVDGGSNSRVVLCTSVSRWQRTVLDPARQCCNESKRRSAMKRRQAGKKPEAERGRVQANLAVLFDWWRQSLVTRVSIAEA